VPRYINLGLGPVDISHFGILSHNHHFMPQGCRPLI
jgi:hypothetical protein